MEQSKIYEDICTYVYIYIYMYIYIYTHICVWSIWEFLLYVKHTHVLPTNILYELPREDTLQHFNAYIKSYFFQDLLYSLIFLSNFKIKIYIFFYNSHTCTICSSCRHMNICDYILITNVMLWLLFIHKILYSSTCFEP